jgi:DNA-binding response OmpR family regulator
VQAGRLTINLATRLALWDGRKLALTPTEFSLLAQLIVRPGRVVVYSELYALMTGQHIDPQKARISLKTYMSTLRAKLTRHGCLEVAEALKTVWGRGFVWDSEGSAGARVPAFQKPGNGDS